MKKDLLWWLALLAVTFLSVFVFHKALMYYATGRLVYELPPGYVIKESNFHRFKLVRPDGGGPVFVFHSRGEAVYQAMIEHHRHGESHPGEVWK